MANEHESVTEFSEKVKEQLRSYVQTRIDLLKAESAEKLSSMLSRMVTGLILLGLLFLTILFGSLVAGFYLGDLFGSLKYGFGIMALFYLLLLGVFFLFRKKMIQYPIADFIIAIIYQQHDED